MMSHEREMLISRRRLLEIGAGLGLMAIVTGCGILADKSDSSTPSVSPEHESSHEIDLISGGTWQYIPGAKKEGNSLKIESTGLAVRTLEDTWVEPSLPEYIPVTPQNLYGTYLNMSDADGSIGFKAHLSDVQGKATLSFESRPMYHYDERAYRHFGADVQIDDTNLILSYWQEGQTTPTLKQVIPFDKKLSDAEFTLTQTERGITVTINGQSATIPAAKAFTAGEVWFGMDASNSWKLDSLHAYPLDDNKINLADVSKIDFGKLSPGGLQAAISKKRPDLIIGTAVDPTSLFTDPHYAKLVTEQFGGVETEMVAKFQALQPEKGRFVWNDLDSIVAFAEKNHKRIHGHTLIFGEANPRWLEDELRHATPEEALKLERDHIKAVVGRYKGKIKAWDVVNEPFDADVWEELRQHEWMKAIGPAYIDEAFKAAHKADPKAELYMNEWGLESDDDRWNAMVTLLKDMKSRGVPIHGVGFQAHFDEETLSDDEVMNAVLSGGRFEQRFKELEELGLKVRVSEISVAGGDKNLQARIYAAVLKACVNAPNCTGFNMWGAVSNTAYFTSEPDNNTGLIEPEQFGDDAPWQQNKSGDYSPKPAVAAMEAVVK